MKDVVPAKDVPGGWWWVQLLQLQRLPSCQLILEGWVIWTVASQSVPAVEQLQLLLALLEPLELLGALLPALLLPSQALLQQKHGCQHWSHTSLQYYTEKTARQVQWLSYHKNNIVKESLPTRDVCSTTILTRVQAHSKRLVSCIQLSSKMISFRDTTSNTKQQKMSMSVNGKINTNWKSFWEKFEIF